MNWDFAFLGLVVISFFAAFCVLKWGEKEPHDDDKDSWRFTHPGGGV